MKACNVCRETLPLASFYVDRRNQDGRFGTCRVCTQRRARERKDEHPDLRRRDVERTAQYRRTDAGRASRRREYERHRDKVIARANAWNRAHPERVLVHTRRRRERLGNLGRIRGISRTSIAEKVAYWGGRCWICGAPWEQIDHVKPVAAGGIHLLCNLRPICGSCNRGKGAAWPFNTRSVA